MGGGTIQANKTPYVGVRGNGKKPSKGGRGKNASFSLNLCIRQRTTILQKKTKLTGDPVITEAVSSHSLE